MRNDLQGQQKLFTDEAIIKPHDYQSETVDLVLKHWSLLVWPSSA